MLSQLSQALEPQQELQMLQLQEQEMELLRNNYNAVITASTLVLGFAYGGCIDFSMPGADPIPPGETAAGMRPEVLICFYLCMSISVVLETYSAVVATAAVVYGPDMAINGAHGSSTGIEVACTITRAIGGMRLAKYHIYGSFAAGLFFLLVGTCLGTMDKIGYAERMGVSTSAHKGVAGLVAVIFGGGLFIIAWAFLGAQKVFSAERLTDSRRAHPGVPCAVCGDSKRDGLTLAERSFFRMSCGADSGEGFKCYQCIGLRADFTDDLDDSSGGCCGNTKSAPPMPQGGGDLAASGWFYENTPYAQSQASEYGYEPSEAPSPVSPTGTSGTRGRRPGPQRAATADFHVGDHFRPGSARPGTY